MKTDINFVYMTCADKEEARNIGRVLVESRLAACVNILDPMESLYWWDGAVQNDQETVLIAKTTRDKVPELKKQVIIHHSYECPCIVCLPVDDGHEGYLEWIRDQVAGELSS
jgi:periplasmic divalent cation tolerance protein